MAMTVYSALDEPAARLRPDELLRNMRLVTRRFLVWEEAKTSGREFENCKPRNLNPQEEGIWLQPGSPYVSGL
jgi:hypothetical protein